MSANRPGDLWWFRSHLLTDILPRWRESACTASGLFIPHLDRQWRRKGEPTGTIVSQGRLLYNFAAGYRLTGEEQYLDAVENGTDFLLESFHDDEQAGWFYRCDWNGEVLDDTKDSYGHAFVAFGLAHSVSVTHSEEDRMTALAALVGFARFLDEHAGLAPRKTRDFSKRVDEGRPINSQNPMMHVFEAYLAAMELLDQDTARAFGELVTWWLFSIPKRPPGDGLPELYTEDWQPLPSDQGGRIDIAHQFEWAFLLSRAVELGFPEEYLDRANQLLEYGMRVGYDPEEGGIFANASLEGEIIDRAKGWWQQCEAARALMHFAVVRGRDDLWEPFERTMAYCKEQLIDPECGGWYANESKDKGNEWKVDYHVVAMCEEAIRLAEMVGESE